MKNGNTVYASETFAFEECTHPPNTNEKSWSRLDAKFPDVMTEWVNACNGRDYFDGAPGEIGQRVVLVLHAMYESAKEVDAKSIYTRILLDLYSSNDLNSFIN